MKPGSDCFVAPASSCSSRTKNMMWYGVLGTKELVQKTYKNLEQRVQLEVKHIQQKRATLGNKMLPAVLAPFLTSPSSISLQCDGVPMSLPSLQGLAVLNIPSYAGGINFWGGTKEDNVSVAKEVLHDFQLCFDLDPVRLHGTVVLCIFRD